MTFNRRDISAAPDGSFYSVLAPEGIVHIRCAVSGDGTRWRIESGDAPEARVYREDVVVLRFPGAYGAGFSALRATADSVEVYLSSGNINDRTDVYVNDAEGVFLRNYDVPYSSQGILDIAPDGTPIMDMGQTRVVQGVTLYHATECRGHLVGLADGGDHRAGCIVWVQPDGTLLMHQVTRDVQLPPRIAVNHLGEARIVYSGWDSPEPEHIDVEPYRHYVAPVPARPAFPPPPTTMPPLWIGVDVTGVVGPVPGNCTWSAVPGDTRPVTEMAAWAHTLAGRRLLMGLWLSDNNTAPETVQPEIDFAAAQGARAVYLHQDDRSATQAANLQTAAAIVSRAGLLPILGSHVVQDEPVIVDGAWGVTLNIRTAGKDLARLRDGVVNAMDVLQNRPGATCLLIFGWAPCDWPALQEYLRAVIAVTPTPDRFPGVFVAPSDAPPVAPPAAPSPPRRKRGWLAQVVAWWLRRFR